MHILLRCYITNPKILLSKMFKSIWLCKEKILWVINSVHAFLHKDHWVFRPLILHIHTHHLLAACVSFFPNINVSLVMEIPVVSVYMWYVSDVCLLYSRYFL
jgi:hypothetical protein